MNKVKIVISYFSQFLYVLLFTMFFKFTELYVVFDMYKNNKRGVNLTNSYKLFFIKSKIVYLSFNSTLIGDRFIFLGVFNLLLFKMYTLFISFIVFKFFSLDYSADS